MIRRYVLILFWISLLIFIACDNPLKPKTETLRISSTEQQLKVNGDITHMAWRPGEESILYSTPVQFQEYLLHDFENNDLGVIGTFVNGLNSQNYYLSEPNFSNDFQYAVFVGRLDVDSGPDIYELWLYQFSNQSLKKMCEFEDASSVSSDVTWSNANDRIAIPVRNYRLYPFVTEIHVISLSGEHSIYCNYDLDYAIYPFWSPDDSEIGLYARLEGYSGLFVLDLNAGSFTQIVTEKSESYLLPHAQWLANKRVVVYSERLENQYSLCLVDLETQSNITLVDTLSSLYYFAPTKLEDEIQFVGYGHSGDMLFTYSIENDRFSYSTIYRNYQNISQFFNQYIIEEKRSRGNYIINYSIETQQKEIMTTSPAEIKSLTWAPDGEHFLFVKDENLYSYYLSNQEESLYLDGASANHIEYAPDGSSIVYDDNEGKIYIINVQDKSSIQMNPDIYPCLTNPTWSPSGEKIASLDRNGNIVIFRKNGKGAFEYEKTLGGEHMDIQWSKMKGSDNSPILYFYGTQKNYYYPVLYEIRAVEPDKGREYLLGSELKAYSTCWSADGTRLAYAKSDSIIVKPMFVQMDALN